MPNLVASTKASLFLPRKARPRSSRGGSAREIAGDRAGSPLAREPDGWWPAPPSRHLVRHKNRSCPCIRSRAAILPMHRVFASAFAFPLRALQTPISSALQVKGAGAFSRWNMKKTMRESNSITVSRALSIRECAQATGVTSDTLRYYEKIGLLTRVPRERNGIAASGKPKSAGSPFCDACTTAGCPFDACSNTRAFFGRATRRSPSDAPCSKRTATRSTCVSQHCRASAHDRTEVAL